MHRDGRITVYENKDPTLGTEISYETPESRKTFHLPRPDAKIEDSPLAIESFAQDPQHYAELMKRVEQYLLESPQEESKR